MFGIPIFGDIVRVVKNVSALIEILSPIFLRNAFESLVYRFNAAILANSGFACVYLK